ncbi:MAG: tape measure protein [Angelakisella sp.]
MSKTLKTYGYDEKEMMPTLTAVGDAGSALGMNADDMKMVATGLGRMRTSGKTNAEYMNLLLERGIPVYDYLGKGLNKTKAEVIEMLGKGDIGGAMAAQIITDYMGSSFKGSMNEQAKTFSGLESTVMGLKQNMDAALGEGYTEERKSGLSSEIEYYSGEGGAQEEKANRLMGQWKASLENTHNQMQLDFKTAIMTGVMPDNLDAELTKKLRAMNIDYTWLSKNGGDGAGAKMGGILAESMVLAENEYMASEGALLEIETQKALVKAVRDDTAVKEEYWKSGYDLQQEFTKGQKAANERYGIEQFKPQVVDPMSNPKFAAYAGRYMPLPAADSPRSSNTTVNINGTYQVRSDADVAAVAQELARKINQYSSVTVQ